MSAARAVAKVSVTFAGYGQNGNSSSSLKVTATLVVPKLKCGTKASAFFPNIGFSTAGAPSWAGLFIGCSHGKQHAWPAVGFNGAETDYKTGAAVKAGDTVVLTVSENATDTVVTVLDKTQRFKKRLTGAGSSGVSDPWIGENTWNDTLPLPNFDTLKFADDRVNGAPFGTWPGGLTRWTMKPTTGGVITTGPFSSSGTAFATHYSHS
jgi:hypothetical protein